jgi:hypothetical protein
MSAGIAGNPPTPCRGTSRSRAPLTSTPISHSALFAPLDGGVFFLCGFGRGNLFVVAQFDCPARRLSSPHRVPMRRSASRSFSALCISMR